MLTERNRAVLYRRLTDLVGDEEAIGEMLSNFPATDLDRPATESFVRSEIAALRSEMHKQTTQLIMWFVGVQLTWGALLLAVVGLT